MRELADCLRDRVLALFAVDLNQIIGGGFSHRILLVKMLLRFSLRFKREIFRFGEALLREQQMA